MYRCYHHSYYLLLFWSHIKDYGMMREWLTYEAVSFFLNKKNLTTYVRDFSLPLGKTSSLANPKIRLNLKKNKKNFLFINSLLQSQPIPAVYLKGNIIICLDFEAVINAAAVTTAVATAVATATPSTVVSAVLGLLRRFPTKNPQSRYS